MKPLLRHMTIFFFTVFGSAAAWAQASPDAPIGLEQGQTPALQFGAQFHATYANAPPDRCGCFWFQGGGAQVNLSLRPYWSIAADVMYAKASNINNSGENLSLVNYTFGPRYTMWRQSRISPYGQVLVGVSHVASNYAIYGSGKNAFAGMAGLGIDYRVTPRYSIVPIEADYIYSRAINSTNTQQSDFRLGAGIVYRMGPH